MAKVRLALVCSTECLVGVKLCAKIAGDTCIPATVLLLEPEEQRMVVDSNYPHVLSGSNPPHNITRHDAWVDFARPPREVF